MKRLTIIIAIIMGTSVSQAVSNTESGKSINADVLYNHYYELPYRVAYRLNDEYRHFELIHSRKTSYRGRLVYEVLIRHRKGYSLLTIGQNGRIFDEARYRNYPLGNHYCNNSCGFEYESRKQDRHHRNKHRRNGHYRIDNHKNSQECYRPSRKHHKHKRYDHWYGDAGRVVPYSG